MQRSVVIIVTSGMKKSSEKNSNFCSFCLDFRQTLPPLFLRNSYFSKILITIFGNNVRQRVSADLSRLVIRDLDKAKHDKIVAHLF